MIHRLMMKVFYQLIARWKRLGANVIYASFNSIIIETKKFTYKNSSAYIHHCIETICKQPLFEYLTLKVGNVWDCLLWY
ncbi:DNA polymerase epsilon catalytic subunit a Pol2, partial [Reticulomyxa filosa]